MTLAKLLVTSLTLSVKRAQGAFSKALEQYET
jgi:hypothetical protein